MARVVKAGEFKAKCLQLMDEVAATGEPVTVTKRGKPVVRVVPAAKRPGKLRGFLKGSIEITGDIISPIDVEWDAMKS